MKRHRTRSVLAVSAGAALALTLALTGCTDVSTTPAGASTPLALNAPAPVQTAIDELVAMPGGPPGVAVIVQRGAVRTFLSGGVAELGGSAPIIGSHMRIASVAKAFSGATALALVDRHQLRLDETIGELLPDLPAPWHPVTLKQLLMHTSGIGDFVQTEAFLQAYTAHPDDPSSPQELVSFAPTALEFAPGSRYVYSNTDNIIVALMVEAATGRSYTDVLSERVLKPLGLRDTSLPHGADIPAPTMHGYAITDDNPTPEDVTDGFAGGWAFSSGGIVSTPADLNTFIRGYVSGRLFSRALRTTWQQTLMPDSGSEPTGPGFNSAGMAVFRYQLPCGTVYGHTGNTVGYTQFAAASPDGTRSATVSISLQRTQHNEGQAARVYQGMERVISAAVCAALS